MNRIALLLGLVCLPTLALANDLIGFWKVDDQPAWIEIHGDTEITLLDPSSLQIEVKVGFRSRASAWKRVARIPGNE